MSMHVCIHAIFNKDNLSCDPNQDERLVNGRTNLCGSPSGMGADPNRPPCRKAKDLRKERRLQKQHGGGAASTSPALKSAPLPPPQGKSLEDFFSDSLAESTHRLEVSEPHPVWCCDAR